MTNRITPHKGGRSKSGRFRLTPDEKQRLDNVLAQKELSLADYIMEKVDDDMKTKAMVKNMETNEIFFADISDLPRINSHDYDVLNGVRSYAWDTEYGALSNRVPANKHVGGTWTLQCDDEQFNRAKAELPHINDYVGKSLLDSLVKG